MKRSIIIGILSSLAACSLFKSGGGQVVINDLGGVASCIIMHANADTSPTFEGIAAECAGAALSDVIAIVGALELSNSVEAGPRLARKVTHKAAK